MDTNISETAGTAKIIVIPHSLHFLEYVPSIERRRLRTYSVTIDFGINIMHHAIIGSWRATQASARHQTEEIFVTNISKRALETLQTSQSWRRTTICRVQTLACAPHFAECTLKLIRPMHGESSKTIYRSKNVLEISNLSLNHRLPGHYWSVRQICSLRPGSGSPRSPLKASLHGYWQRMTFHSFQLQVKYP